MAVRLPEPLSADVFTYGYFEEGLSTVMLARLAPGMTFVDVGAHYGYFTLLAAHLVGDRGHVHSFEPTPGTFGILRANTTSLANVTVNSAAVWHERATLQIQDFGPALSMYNSLGVPRLGDHQTRRAQAREVTVEAVSLDQYVARTGAVPDFVKIDAESTELQVLQGMTEVMERHRPTVSIEVGDLATNAPVSRTLLEYVIDRGYEPFEVMDGEIRPHSLSGRYEYDNILLVPR